ncbi:hypothetical protein DZC78_11555 [Olleya aquimaris]|nr:hypothetical protein DZC78_11555 [Olleya aquimaris]
MLIFLRKISLVKKQLILYKTVVSNMRKTVSIIIFVITLIFLSCKDDKNLEVGATIKNNETSNWKDYWEKPNERAELIANPIIHERIKQCLKDTSIIVLTSMILENPTNYSKVKYLGDINKDGLNDSILIIPELYITKDKSYENGASVIFTDNQIPRIKVDVSCLETEYIFRAFDIDDDGIAELGKYYTSCASRFKTLELISLKNNNWNILGQVLFDTWYENPIIEERIRKIGQNKFQMREITEEIDIWKTFIAQ